MTYGDLEHVSIVTVAPELEGGMAAIEQLSKRGVVVSLGANFKLFFRKTSHQPKMEMFFYRPFRCGHFSVAGGDQKRRSLYDALIQRHAAREWFWGEFLFQKLGMRVQYCGQYCFPQSSSIIEIPEWSASSRSRASLIWKGSSMDWLPMAFMPIRRHWKSPTERTRKVWDGRPKCRFKHIVYRVIGALVSVNDFFEISRFLGAILVTDAISAMGFGIGIQFIAGVQIEITGNHAFIAGKNTMTCCVISISGDWLIDRAIDRLIERSTDCSIDQWL